MTLKKRDSLGDSRAISNYATSSSSSQVKMKKVRLVAYKERGKTKGFLIELSLSLITTEWPNVKDVQRFPT